MHTTIIQHYIIEHIKESGPTAAAARVHSVIFYILYIIVRRI